MTRRSLEIRDRFTPQVFYNILNSLNSPVSLCVSREEDFESHLALQHLQGYTPIIIRDSQMHGAEKLLYEAKTEKLALQGQRLPIHLEIHHIKNWISQKLSTNTEETTIPLKTA